MDDPDMGVWTYEHDPLGQLKEQTDANGTVTTMSYDILGRMVSRSVDPVAGPTLAYAWTYDTAAGAGLGKPATETAPDGFAKTFAYDSLGRPASTTIAFDDKFDGGSSHSYTVSTTYDAYSRVEKTIYPLVPGYSIPFHTKNTYHNATGTLLEVSDSFAQVWWNNPKHDSSGRLVEYQYGGGNLIRTEIEYEGGTGFIERIRGFTPGSGTADIQDWSFSFDNVGNLTGRANYLNSVSASYGYDALNRLTHRNSFEVVKYDSLGNITEKDGLGYAYSPSRPHAVQSVNGSPAYQYDSNGSVTSYAGRTIAWEPFSKPSEIALGTYKVEFQYDASQNRLVESDNGRLKHFIAGIYERQKQGSTITHRHFIATPSGVAGVYDVPEGGGSATRSYFHKDHLGSVVLVTNNSPGTLAQRRIAEYAYDSWGKPVSPTNWSSSVTWDHSGSKDRGFTSHEMLDGVEIVHMNGRIYDPLIGRFLSADPFVQSDADLQSYNRYSYVLNNPLSFTDPSGHFVNFIAGVITAIGKFAVNIVPAIVNNAWAVATAGGWQSALFWGSVGFGAYTGYQQGGWSGALQGALFSAASAGAAYAVGQAYGGTGGFWHELARAVDHGLYQGAIAEVFGADFESAFYGAFAGSLVSHNPTVERISGSLQSMGPIGELVAASAVGGTVSAITGGSFGNGARSAAFQWMYNKAITSARSSQSGTAAGGGSKLGNALRKTPIAGFALGSAGDILSGKIGHGVSSFVNTLVADVSATVVGAFGKVYVTATDIGKIGGSLFSGNLKGFGINLAKSIHHLVVPNYGWYGGAGWGLEQDSIWGRRNPFNAVDANSRIHDGSGGNHLGWVFNNWRDLGTVGPIGSAYTLLGTVPFAVGDFITDDGRP